MAKSRPTSLSKTITAYDVARLARVTQATVSRTINKPDAVAPATRARVHEAMKALNYIPSASAQGLARGKSGVIGLLVSLDVSNARVFGFLVDGIVSVLAEGKYLLNMGHVSSASDVSAEEILESPLLRKHYCDGIIMHLPHFVGDTSRIYHRIPCPYVDINPASPQAMNCVVPDDRGAAETAVGHLVSRGHRRIAYLGSMMDASGPQHAYVRARHDGYIMSMSRVGLSRVERSDEPVVIPARGSYAEIQSQRYARIEERLEFWLTLEDPVTAVVAQDSGMANSIAEVAYDREWRIPGRFSLISCDDISIGFSSSLPITAVDLNLMTIGAEAARMVLRRLDGPEVPIPSVTVPGKLRERKTIAVMGK